MPTSRSTKVDELAKRVGKLIVTLEATFAKAGFNPNQPRGEGGKWSSAGGGSSRPHLARATLRAGVRSARITARAVALVASVAAARDSDNWGDKIASVNEASSAVAELLEDLQEAPEDFADVAREIQIKLRRLKPLIRQLRQGNTASRIAARNRRRRIN